MKHFYILLVSTLFLACSNKEPVIVPLEPKQVWIDEATQSDTIITGEGYGTPHYLYFGAKNWQTSPDTSLTHGFRNIAIHWGDSILVKPLNDPSTNYDGPFFFRVEKSKTTLQAQNFLNTRIPNDVRIFIPLR